MSKNAELFARLKAQKDADKPFLATIFDELKKHRDKVKFSHFYPSEELRFAFGVYGDWLSDTSRWKLAKTYWGLRDLMVVPGALWDVRGPGGIPKAVKNAKKIYGKWLS